MKKFFGILAFILTVMLGFAAVIFKLSGDDIGAVLEGVIILVYILAPLIFVAALIYGIFCGFNLLLPIITAALSVAFIFYINGDNPTNPEQFILPAIAFVIAILGNAVGRIFYKKKK